MVRTTKPPRLLVWRPCRDHNGFDPDLRFNHVRDRSVQIDFGIV